MPAGSSLSSVSVVSCVAAGWGMSAWSARARSAADADADAHEGGLP